MSRTRQKQRDAERWTSGQLETVASLKDKYDIDPIEVVLLENGELWLKSRALLKIARQSEEFASIEEAFSQFLPALKQVIYRATVIDRAGHQFTRTGVASMGERLPSGETADAHELAASRALGKALDAAGFNPLRRTPVASRTRLVTVDEAGSRLQDLKTIHALAREAGFSDHLYREYLAELFGVTSCAGMNEAERASVINALRLTVREAQTLRV